MNNKWFYSSCLVSLLFTSCIPSFKPKEELIKSIKVDLVTIKWIKAIGVIDQNFPSYIIIEGIQKPDTICIAYNVASLDLKDNKILVGFYGTPVYTTNSNHIKDSNIYGYETIADTTKVDSTISGE